MNEKTKTLNDGTVIPLIGLGTSRIGKPPEVTEIIYNCIKFGTRLIDTAYKYRNEEAIGLGIKKAINDKICERKDLIIMGKLWIHQRNDPEKALRESLKKLQLDYIDIYMDHWPSGKDYRKPEDRNNCEDEEDKKKFDMVSIYDLWPKMENLIKLKLTKSLGVSNYNIQCLSNLLSFCKTKPVINEIEYHLFYIQKTLKEFCDKQDIAIISYYPMPYGNGAKKYIHIENHPEFNVFEDPLIKKLSEEYGKSKGQIILNWHYKSGVIPIPSTTKNDRMKENLEALDFNLKEKDFKKLSSHFKQISLKKFCGCRRFFGVNVLA